MILSVRMNYTQKLLALFFVPLLCLCCYTLRNRLQKWRLDHDQTVNACVSIRVTSTLFIKHFVHYNLSAPSALTASFCHSSSVSFIPLRLLLSPIPSPFSHLSHFYLLSFYLFYLEEGSKGKESAPLLTHSEKCHFICLTLSSFWLKVKPFNFLPENH